MPLFRKPPVVIEAHQRYRIGDHPDDDCGTRPDGDGRVVRYYRHPEVPGSKRCEQCGRLMEAHGWIDTLEDGHVVCPGDWIITGVAGEEYPCKPDIFDATYEPVGAEAGA